MKELKLLSSNNMTQTLQYAAKLLLTVATQSSHCTLLQLLVELTCG